MGVAIVYLMIIHDSAESSKLMRVSIEKREELIRDSKVEGRIFQKQHGLVLHFPSGNTG